VESEGPVISLYMDNIIFSRDYLQQQKFHPLPTPLPLRPLQKTENVLVYVGVVASQASRINIICYKKK